MNHSKSDIVFRFNIIRSKKGGAFSFPLLKLRVIKKGKGKKVNDENTSEMKNHYQTSKFNLTNSATNRNQ